MKHDSTPFLVLLQSTAMTLAGCGSSDGADSSGDGHSGGVNDWKRVGEGEKGWAVGRGIKN